MPARVTRSGREVKNSSTSQKKLDALELLERQRRGEKVDIGIKEDEPLFEEVDEDDYKRTHKGGFIVDPESDVEIDDDDLNFIDDDDEELEPKRRAKGSKKRLEPDARQPSMKSFLGSKGKSTNSHQASTSKQATEVNQDDILSQMLFDVPMNRASSAQKPLKILSRLPPTKPSPSLKTKANFDIATTKRARLSNPPASDDADHSAPPMECWPDDMEDSLPAPTAPYDSLAKKRKIDPVFEQMSTQESISEKDDMNVDSVVEATHLSDDLKKNIQFFEHTNGKEYCRFYWYDCTEDQLKSPGSIHLFGRIPVSNKKFVSSCAIVKNIKRTCYLLIAPDCTYEEVVGEFTHIIAKRLKIKDFTCEKVTKKYAFSSDSTIPLISDYVKIEYSCNQAALPADLKGETFSHILNNNQSPMEKILLDLKLRGPCWLRLVDPSEPIGGKLTHTRIELILNSPNNLLVENEASSLDVPYFCAFALSLRIYTNPINHANEIVAIAGMVNTCIKLDECLNRKNKASGHFLLMSKPASSNKQLKIPYDFQAVMKKYKKTRFELFENERDLLSAFLDKFVSFDPDIVIGHELLSCDYETILSRVKYNKVAGWSQLGRFPRTEFPATKTAFRNMFSGRIMCDVEASAKELISARSYDLTELMSKVLGTTRVEYNHEGIVESYKTSESLINLLNATWDDTDSIFSILAELNVIPLALKITNITGGVLSRTLSGGRSERNDYLLLHAFHEENFICPEKQFSKFANKKGPYMKNGNNEELAPTRRKAAYAGGLVLEPKTGYYDTCILLMDFNSLYPSIIQEFNICFSTVKIPAQQDDANAEIIAKVPDESAAVGILPAQLKKLVDGRKAVKRRLAETNVPNQKIMLDIEQKALKLTANSMYGCLGFEYCRFYAKHLASLVTFKGREILMSTKAMVEKLGYEVIYGDTDSLMIDTKIVEYDEVIERGNSIKSEINRAFRLLEIDIDGVYCPLLLLKKKNYAGASLKKSPDGQIVKSIETKGLDTVRRDRAVIAKEAGERVLSMVLSGEKDIALIVEEIHSYLKELGANAESSQIPLEKFLISKQLNRNPEEYRDTKGIGHVTLALRHNQNPKNTKKLRAGHTVEYVICLDGKEQSANQRAYTLHELATDENLKLDTEYYLCQQIHPVMARICDKLPITNAYVIAEMLGIEKSSMLHIKREDTNEAKRDQLLSKGESRFNSCKPLTIQCPNCNLPDSITSRTRKNKDNKLELSLTRCGQCGAKYALNGRLVTVQIIALIKQMTLQLYNRSYSCSNTDCEYTTRNIFGALTNDDDGTETPESLDSKSEPICALCGTNMSTEVDDRKTDQQLAFIKHLFDVTREQEAGEVQDIGDDIRDMYKDCFNEANYALRCSFINNIDAYSVFSMISSGRGLSAACNGDSNNDV